MGERRCGGGRPVGRRGSGGASLVEMVLVVAVAGILLGTAWPGVVGYLETAELRSATLRFASALVRGRVAALTEGRVWTVRLDGPGGFVLAPAGTSAAAERLPARTFFAGATSGGDVRFFPSGLADNATFTLGAGAARRRVVVNQRGRVTVE